ncbi:uncharacterized protein N7496_003207 [Penicillium cataractarum]|uniref:Uncharacterized protein n=1 Tax=Penicillium cataractarum TaxID=2100454 RepID=A0A9W9SNY7_9EURO|nr:uncharacterized protein N7496_003207 [Penicillium cataractarum]KAJ5380779.1 hypothetical protein N7496_003207 [Penicillium cataractarum]
MIDPTLLGTLPEDEDCVLPETAFEGLDFEYGRPFPASPSPPIFPTGAPLHTVDWAHTIDWAKAYKRKDALTNVPGKRATDDAIKRKQSRRIKNEDTRRKNAVTNITRPAWTTIWKNRRYQYNLSANLVLSPFQG